MEERVERDFINTKIFIIFILKCRILKYMENVFIFNFDCERNFRMNKAT